MVALLLGFWGLWLHDLGRFAFTSDESASALMADMAMGGIQRQNQDSPHVPVHNLIMRAWRVSVGGQSELLLRIPSTLFGMLLLSLVYRAGRDLKLSLTGTFAAVLLVGLNPQITLHLREMRPYAPMVTGVAFAAVITLRFERLKLHWVSTLSSLLALLTHYFLMPFIGTLGLWGFLEFRGRTRRDWIIWQGAAWLFMAAWLPLMGRAFFNSTSLSTGKTWSFILPPWEALARLAVVGAQGYREYTDLWLAIPGAVLLVGGWLIGSLLAQGRRRWFLLLMVALPVVAYSLLAWVRPVFHPKFMLPWLVFMSLAIGSWITHQPRWGGLAGAALCALMIMPTLRTIQRPYDPGVVATADLSPLPRELSQQVLRVAAPHDVFALGTPDPVHCYYFQHFFDRSLDCALLPRSPAQSLAEVTQQAADLLAAHEVLWYLDFYNPAWDPNRLAEEAFRQSAVSLGDEDLAGHRMLLYASPAVVERQQQRLGARFGGVAELSGVWTIQGDKLHTVLIWKALTDRPAVNAKVFVQLVDPSGYVVGQDDSVPVNWTRPLSGWQPGETLLDVHVLNLPAGVDLQNTALHIGLYDADTLERLSATDASGSPLPDNAAVTPPTSTARSPFPAP